MRRWRGNQPVPLDGRELAQRRAAATCRFRGCSVRAGTHLLCSPRRHAPAGVRPGSRPAKPSAFAPPHPRATSAALGLRPPRALRLHLASLISELASHEVPGFGAAALPSALGLEALAAALAIARDRGVSASGQRWRTCLRRRGNPAGVASAETRPSLPVQRHPRGSNRVGEEGRVNEEISGSPVRGHWRAQVTRVSRGCTPERGVDVEDPGRGGGPRVSRLGGEAVAAGIPTSLRT